MPSNKVRRYTAYSTPDTSLTLNLPIYCYQSRLLLSQVRIVHLPTKPKSHLLNIARIVKMSATETCFCGAVQLAFVSAFLILLPSEITPIQFLQHS